GGSAPAAGGSQSWSRKVSWKPYLAAARSSSTGRRRNPGRRVLARAVPARRPGAHAPPTYRARTATSATDAVLASAMKYREIRELIRLRPVELDHDRRLGSPS